MNTISPESLVSQLSWRYAVKKFDATQKLAAGTWKALEQAMILAPSSYGLQPWKFVVITDPAVKAKLPAISWGQTQPRDCSHMVVFAARKGISAEDVEKYIARISQVRGVPAAALGDFKGMMLGTISSGTPEYLDNWTARQCYIPLGFLLSAAAVLGVDACPMEGIVGAEYDKLLGLDKLGYATVMGCALGTRAADDGFAGMKKVRAEASDVVLRV